MADLQKILNLLKFSLKSQIESQYFTIHQERYRIILNAICQLKLPKNAKALDIGCYPLHLFSILSNEPFTLNMYGISSRHEQVKRNNIAILNIERSRFPFKSNMFDLVMLSEVIEHMTANPTVYLSEIKRVLKPGGFLLITTPNALHLKHRIKLLLGRNPWFSLNELYETKIVDDSIYFRHNREFTLEELKAMIANENLKIKKAECVSFYTPFRKGRKRPLINIVGYGITRIIPSLRDSLFILASK